MKTKTIKELSALEIELLKETYKQGTRIECLYMADAYHAVPKGTLGTVEHVDDVGTIHVSWDNGQGLGLIPNEDGFKKV